MTKVILGGCAAGDRRTRGVLALAGACWPGTVASPHSRDGAVFAAVRPPAVRLVNAGRPRGTHDKQQQSMTRIAAVGGASGSHPAWDPV